LASLPILFLEITLQSYYLLSNGEFLWKRMALPIFVPNEERCYQLKPNLSFEHATNEYRVTIHTNEQGFRTDSKKQRIEKAKKNDHFRVMLLGPSFTFGWANNWEDSFAAIIGNSLSIPNRTVEIINVGTPAQSITQQNCWYNKTGHTFAPDLVIQTVYGSIENFSWNCLAKLNCPTIEDNYLLPKNPRLNDRLINKAKNSALIFYGWFLYQEFTNHSVPAATGVTYFEEEYPNEDYLDHYKNYINRVQNFSEKKVETIFVFIPYSYNIRYRDISRFSHQNIHYSKNDVRQTQAKIKRFNDFGVPFVDPTEALLKNDKQERMYYFLDVHLTPAGNRIVAHEVLSVIYKLLSNLTF
jgi:hypothetical protein